MAEQIIKFILDNWPAIMAVAAFFGLGALLAKHLRALVAEMRAAAKKSPQKWDDFLVDLVDDPLEAIADKLAAGDYSDAEKALKDLRDVVSKAQAMKGKAKG